MRPLIARSPRPRTSTSGVPRPRALGVGTPAPERRPPLPASARLLAASLFATAVALAGCSSDPDPSELDSTTSPAEPDLVEVEPVREAPAEPVGLAEAGQILGGDVGDHEVCVSTASGLVLCAPVAADGTLAAPLRSVPDLVDARQVAVGAGFACALTGDGGVRCWGDGRRGALGPDHLARSEAAVPVGGLPPMVTLSAGGSAACAIDEAGVAWCWGDGYFGQTGAGLAPTPSPPSPLEALPPVDTIAVGARHACAVHRDGLLSCWGDDRWGQLGRGSREGAATLPQRPALAAEMPAVRSIALGDDHTCALTTEGEVLCWGANRDGQLGTGDTASLGQPVRPTLPRGTLGLRAGPDYTCAIGADQMVQCWGANPTGLLEPTLGERVLLPVPAPGVPRDPTGLLLGRGAAWTVRADDLVAWRAAPPPGAPRTTPAPPASARARGPEPDYLGLGPSESGGAYCLVDRDGRVACAGPNDWGQLGDGTRNRRAEPAPLPLPPNARRVAVGARHACAIAGDGGIWCWGANQHGEIGVPDLDYAAVPLPVAGISGSASALVAGRGHTCVLTERGQVSCWGDGRRGQLGQREVGSAPRPRLVELGARALELVAAGDSTCARLEDGAVWCWGANDLGQLGVGDTGDRLLPARAAFTEPAQSVILGPDRLCARVGEGELACAGASATGARLDERTGARFDAVPVVALTDVPSGRLLAGDGFTCAGSAAAGIACFGPRVPEPPQSFAGLTLVAGGSRLCGLAPDGAISCIDGPAREEPTPTPYPAPVMPLSTAERGVSQVAAGARHTCAILEDGVMRCWGDNSRGQLAQGHTDAVEGVVAASGLPLVLLLEAAGDLTCIKAADQEVYCWGGPEGLTAPTLVEGMSGVVDIAVGTTHVCGSMRGGTVRCAGGDDSGQLGDGEPGAPRPAADVVRAVSGAIRVVAGADHSCALAEDGAIWCWGDNGAGQLGDGTLADAAVPRRATLLEGSGPEQRAVAIHAGGDTTCVVDASGALRCAGESPVGASPDGAAHAFLGRGVACRASAEGRLACFSTGAGDEPWPWTIPDATDVVLGAAHGCVLRGSTALQCWGEGPGGALVPGELTRTLIDPTNPPERVPIELSGVTDVALSGTHSCAVAGGAVFCWGDNRAGAVGPAASFYAVEAQVVEGLEATGVGVGDNASCAIVGGGVSCWGDNSDGLVGQPREVRTVTAPTPLPEVEGVVELDVARRHACARAEDGGVWCWGDNRTGAVGSGDRIRRDTPAWVAMPSPAVELALSDSTSCARDAAGAVYCWGELRRARYETRPVQINVPGVAVQLAGGARHLCMRDDAGRVGCWGANEQGQLGQGLCSVRTSFQPVALPAPAADLWVGSEGACARTTAGEVWCWGSASFEEAGFVGLPLPRRVAALDEVARVWPQSGRESCVLRADGAARCWPHEGSLGTEDRGPCDSIEPLLVDAANVDDLCVGGSHACRVAGGVVSCWGGNAEYQARATIADASIEPQPVRFQPLITDVACGRGHSCVIADDGFLRCWGANGAGQVHPTGYSLARQTAVPETGQVQALSLGGNHSCAIDDEGYLICWGDDNFGQVGPREELTYRSTGLGVVRGVAAGGRHTCAILPAGDVRCWGDNQRGQLGRLGVDERAPDRVAGLPPVSALAAGEAATCALTREGEVWCWGDNEWGQLGDGSQTGRHTPRRVPDVEGATQLVMGDTFACTLGADGATCWGDNRRGQAGRGIELALVPTVVEGTAGMARIEAGGSTVCGITAEDVVRCWGAGESGQLGARLP